MLRVTPFANAVAVVMAFLYLLCALVSAVAPEALIGFVQPWVHAVDLDLLMPRSWTFTASGFGLGLVTFTLSAWLVAAACAWLYNRFAGRIADAEIA